jgi:hypothetical protein
VNPAGCWLRSDDCFVNFARPEPIGKARWCVATSADLPCGRRILDRPQDQQSRLEACAANMLDMRNPQGAGVDPAGCILSRWPRLLLENPLHHAGADAELPADLEDAVAAGLQF